MPYIRLYVPELSVDKKRAFAKDLTDTVVGALKIPAEARDWTTIHFITYEPESLAVGGRLVVDGSVAEFYVDYIDLDVNQHIKDDLARDVTAAVGRAFDLEPGQLGRVNFRYQCVKADDIAMGGHYVRKLITT